MTYDQYLEKMRNMQMSGKISGDYGDIPKDDSEMMRRLNAAKEVGLIKEVPYLTVKKPDIYKQTATGGFGKYQQDIERVNKNTRELMALGVPYEKLQPFIARKNEEAAQVHNLNRANQPPPGSQDSFVAWRPQDYIGYSEKVGIEGNSIPLGRLAEDIREAQGSGLSDEELSKQQELLPSSGQSPEAVEESKRKLMEIMRGY